jgi:hypothetical protein
VPKVGVLSLTSDRGMGDWRKHFDSTPFGGFAHPDSPAGGTGPGRSRVPGYSSAEPSDVPHPDSPAGRMFDWSALARIDIDERARAVLDAIRVARRHAPAAILEATGLEFGAMLDGLLPGLLLCLCLVAATTAFGSAAGAAIGALALGIGAAPGAVFGVSAGFEAGLALLEGLGLAFLVAVIGTSVAEAARLAHLAVREAWHSVDEPASRWFHIDHAGRTLAAAAGALMHGVLQGIVAFLLAKGANAAASQVPELVAKLRASRFGEGFAVWVERNWASLIQNERSRTNPPATPAGRDRSGRTIPGRSEPGKRVSRPADKSTAEDQSKPRPSNKRLALTGVTDSDLELAAATGSSPAQMAAREKVAFQFYDQYGKASPANAIRDVRAIDTTQPVRVGPPPPCPSPQAQWQTPGAPQGQYYAHDGVQPTNLGIHDEGNLGPGTPLQAKESQMYDVPPDAPYLESTAAPTPDSWSVSGQTHPTEGGGTQRYIPRASSDVTPAKSATPPTDVEE